MEKRGKECRGTRRWRGKKGDNIICSYMEHSELTLQCASRTAVFSRMYEMCIRSVKEAKWQIDRCHCYVWEKIEVLCSRTLRGASVCVSIWLNKSVRGHRLKMRILSDIREKYLFRILKHRHIEERARIFQVAELCTIWHLIDRIFHMHWEN
jgi:hypothetical protein